MSKNIWIINQYTGGPKYGMNYRSYYLAKEFIKKDAQVTLFAGSFSHLFTNLPKISGNFTTENIDDINFIWVKTPYYKSSKSIKRIWNMLVFMFKLFFFNTTKIEKPDVIIISSLSLFPILNAYFWSKKFNAKLIFEIRDLWPQTLIELGNVSSKHPLVLFLGFFEKFGYKKADAVVSLLQNAKEYMINRGLQKDKFYYIPNGINLEEVEGAVPLCENVQKQLPKNKFLIGYVGTLGIANALEYLLESALALKDEKKIHFVLVGKGGEKEKLENFVNMHDLDNVTFIDPIPKIQVQSMLKYFDVCYIGLKKEPLFRYGVSPNKLFDYMYSAKPILYCIDSGKNNLVSEANCGLSIMPENVAALTEGISTLFHTSNEELQKYGENGKKYVLNNHTYTQLAGKFWSLF